MEEQQQQPPTETTEVQEQSATKEVGTFWNRLDKVLRQNEKLNSVVEQNLLQIFPDQPVAIREYQSFVNQPERVQISSQQDINDYDPYTVTSYYNFRVRLPRPCLNVKSIQLARVSVPNAVVNIPNSETVFWYYALPTVSIGQIFDNNAGAPGDLAYTFDTSGNIYTAPGNVLVPNSAVYFDSGQIKLGNDNYTYSISDAKPGGVNVEVYTDPGNQLEYWIQYTTILNADSVAAPRPNYLRYVRLAPSFVQADLILNYTGGYNRIFQDYQDLVDELNLSCADDLLNGEPENEIPGTFKFVPNQVQFTYSDEFTKIIFTGLDQDFSYLPVASDDPNWFVAAQELAARDEQNDQFAAGEIAAISPFTPYRNLNIRLGFIYAIYPATSTFFNYMIRPYPAYFLSVPNLKNPFTMFDHLAPGFPDLTFSACCYIYTDITGGSTEDTTAEKALLATLPMNTPTLGVGFHSLPLNNPLTKIVNQINEIYIELRTDTGEPFYLPNSAIVSLEFILTY